MTKKEAADVGTMSVIEYARLSQEDMDTFNRYAHPTLLVALEEEK